MRHKLSNLKSKAVKIITLIDGHFKNPITTVDDFDAGVFHWENLEKWPSTSLDCSHKKN